MMKTKFLVVMTTSLMASFALAQGSSSSTTSLNNGTNAAPSQTVNSRNTTLPPSTGGESTASIADNAPKGLKRFSMTLMNETEVASDAGVEQGVNSPYFGLNRIQFGYELTPTKRLMFREDSTFKMPKNKELEFHVVDPFIAYTDTKFAELPGGWVVTIQPRLWLPLGEDTRFKTNSLGGTGGALVIDKSVGRFDLELAGIGQYVFNTQDYYYELNAKTQRFDAKAVTDWNTLYDAQVVYNFTDKFSFQHDTMLYTVAKRATPAKGASSSSTLINETGFGYQFVKQLKVIATVENDASLDAAVDLYQAKDMMYNLYVKLSI